MSVQPRTVKLPRQRGVALYVQVIAAIREMIASEGVRPGDALPTEEKLQAAYGVSRATIRDALAQLEREHLVERRQGVGTFVARPPLKRDLQALTSFSEDMMSRGLRPSSKLLDYQNPAQSDIPEDFAGAPVVRVVRLRLADGEPFGVHDTLIPATIVERIGFSQERLSLDEALSFYASLEAAGYHIEEGREHLSATCADAHRARLLKVQPGTPLMRVVRLSWSPAGELLEHITAHYISERYEYVINLRR